MGRRFQNVLAEVVGLFVGAVGFGLPSFFVRCRGQLSTPRNSKITHTTSTSHATSSVVILGPRTKCALYGLATSGGEISLYGLRPSSERQSGAPKKGTPEAQASPWSQGMCHPMG